MLLTTNCSWRLYPRLRDVDRFAARRYKPFGHFAGLAMWLDLTKDWHEETATGGQEAKRKAF